jgi:type IV secretory pathway VirD2 relaxase
MFAERCKDDRRHFRFIVSPDDAIKMADLKEFTRDLMGQMEKDMGTRLDWAAVEHWNTEHPHIHVIVRGVGDDGQNLVISRDYIREGMRARARELITRELGPRTEIDIRRSLERQVEAERWRR